MIPVCLGKLKLYTVIVLSFNEGRCQKGKRFLSLELRAEAAPRAAIHCAARMNDKGKNAPRKTDNVPITVDQMKHFGSIGRDGAEVVCMATHTRPDQVEHYVRAPDSELRVSSLNVERSDPHLKSSNFINARLLRRPEIGDPPNPQHFLAPRAIGLHPAQCLPHPIFGPLIAAISQKPSMRVWEALGDTLGNRTDLAYSKSDPRNSAIRTPHT
jgi:hypothetical protein